MQVNCKRVREKGFQQLLGHSLQFHPVENRGYFKNVDFHLAAYLPFNIAEMVLSPLSLIS